MYNIDIISYANKPKYYYYDFLNSAKIYNYNVKVLGLNTEWKGFCSKLKHVYEYLINNKNLNEYILLVDSWDLIFTRPYEEFIEDIQEDLYNYDLIIGSEKKEDDGINCIVSKLMDWISERGVNYYTKHINAGAYIIKKDLFINMYKNINPLESMDDQYLIGKFLHEHKNIKYKIDHERKYITNVYGNIADTNIILNKHKGYILHCYGYGNMDKYINYYIGEIKRFNKPNMLLIHISRSSHYLKLLFKNNIIFILCLWLCIALFNIL